MRLSSPLKGLPAALNHEAGSPLLSPSLLLRLLFQTVEACGSFFPSHGSFPTFYLARRHMQPWRSWPLAPFLKGLLSSFQGDHKG